ncbi:ROK family transcriptional regulator [Paenibacillus sp. TRM 82003]|uniref:ROK family transcriptional regulator n=1 Tax=Kineococcus sp. TRM81007 TaxID=2925831 RepID=UPI001F56EA9B|nr:ROK family transcriptional regulator [Kineococcus sp. TRM81007]MCI2240056.1 ROK family transcriptional regulator [Kineococcus sp. TRM81007]MCI3925638.1 ROK family transcriptional regulator [Paenibacillus sp. TRM 82003]
MSLTAPARPGAAWTPLTGPAHSIALEVLLDGPLPRSELARRLELSPGSLTRLSRPLLDSGLLVETTGVCDPVSGRPTRPLDVEEDGHHFVGVKLTADTAYAVLTTLRARVVAELQAPLPDRSPAACVAVVGELVRSLAACAGPGRPGVRAVGVGLGGRVARDGEVLSARYLGWESVPFGRALEAELGLPVVVDNDVLSLTRAEQWFGTARRCDHFAVVVVGTGVGYGLVVHDEVLDHPDAGVGLLGHFPLDPTGPLCPDGHTGCAEAMLTREAVEVRAGLALRRPVAFDEVLGLAAAGEPLARRVVDDSARALGVLLAAIGNLTMPRKVLVSGENAGLAEVGAEALRAGIRAHRHPHASELDVDVQHTGFPEWARGAAVTAIRTFVLGHHR